MNVWYRGAVLAGGVLLLAGIRVGAQIREIGGSVGAVGQKGHLTERPGHPEVLLNTRDGEFVGGERTVAQFMLKQLDPRAAVGKLPPPGGIDGIIAYPGSRMLMVRGTKEAVAAYRASLQHLDGEAIGAEMPSTAPEIRVDGKSKLSLKADQVTRAGNVTRAVGHVVINLGGGIELHAHQIRIAPENGGRRIVIEK